MNWSGVPVLRWALFSTRALPSTLLEQWLGQAGQAVVNGAPNGRDKAMAGANGQASGPVVEFVDAAIRAAFANGASDIHFECSRTRWSSSCARTA